MPKYRITFQFKTKDNHEPVETIFEYLPCFDALLWYCLSQEIKGKPKNLPLVINNDIYRAGIMTFATSDMYSERIHYNYITTDSNNSIERKQYIKLQLFKCYFIFETDELDTVINLIDTHLHSIGAFRNDDYGLIANYEITTTDEPIIRPIPLGKANDKTTINNIVFRGFKPPYNYKKNSANCVIGEI